jgi:hypothetical protein
MLEQDLCSMLFFKSLQRRGGLVWSGLGTDEGKRLVNLSITHKWGTEQKA